MKSSALLRWTGSFALGLVVVYSLLVFGLRIFGFGEESGPARQTRVVELMNEIERVRLRDELGLNQRRARPEPPPPPPVIVQRQVSGFVQIEVEVGTGGEVLDAEVVGAMPEGYYEERALEEVRRRRYEPAPLGSYRQSEVVPFSITVEESLPPDR